MKVKTLKELQYMSEELQIAYVRKCIAYFEKKYQNEINASKQYRDGKMTPEDREEYERLMDVFQYSRMTDTY